MNPRECESSPLQTRRVQRSRQGIGGLALGLILLVACRPRTTPPDERQLEFLRDGQLVRRLRVQELGTPQPVTAWDPYYQREKTFLAVPLAPLLRQGFSGLSLDGEEAFLRAQDGYTVPIAVERLLEPGGFVALSDRSVPPTPATAPSGKAEATWEPIGPQRADPRPFYLFWSGRDQGRLETHPRPWQLVAIELSRTERRYPHIQPRGLPGSDPAWRGLRLFTGECIRCHAINREGGRVGPDLNVPQSIVEYRPPEQIRAYIVDPGRFRYGSMPAHPHLDAADLDALLAYFAAMKSRKFDPDARATPRPAATP